MSKTQQIDVIRKTETLEELTVREKEVLSSILSGESNREIAQALFISESTVKTHARNIFSKYDVGSRAELISTLLKNSIRLITEKPHIVITSPGLHTLRPGQ